jgi:hypothetical protein
MRGVAMGCSPSGVHHRPAAKLRVGGLRRE